MNHETEFVRASMIWSMVSELLIEGAITKDLDDYEELLDVIIDSWTTIYWYRGDKYKEQWSEMLKTLPQFEVAFPGLTKKLEEMYNAD